MIEIVITGIGIATSNGYGPDMAFNRKNKPNLPKRAQNTPYLLQPITDVDAQLKKFEVDRRLHRNMVRHDRLAVLGALLAVADSDLSQLPSNCSLYVAGSKEVSDPSKILDAVLTAKNDGENDPHMILGSQSKSQVYPLFYIEGLQAASLFFISKALNIRGGNAYIHGTGEAGFSALDMGRRSIMRGETEVAIVGASDDAISWWNRGKYKYRTTSSSARDSQSSGARHPHNTALGEATVFLILESATHAATRGATPYCKLVDVVHIQNGAESTSFDDANYDLSSGTAIALERNNIDIDDIRAIVFDGNEDSFKSNLNLNSEGNSADAGTQVTDLRPIVGYTLAASGLIGVAYCASYAAALDERKRRSGYERFKFDSPTPTASSAWFLAHASGFFSQLAVAALCAADKED